MRGKALLCAVISAVIFLGDDFGFVNAIGLVVLIFGAGLFNYTKYQKLIEKDPKLPRSQSKPPCIALFIAAYGETRQTSLQLSAILEADGLVCLNDMACFAEASQHVIWQL